MKMHDDLVDRRRMLVGAGAVAATAVAATAATAMPAAADVRKGPNTVVDGMSDLRGLDMASSPVAYLSDPGREGTFVWRIGDFSTLVDGDAESGVYVASDSVSPSQGAWVRDHDGTLNIRWFGATGDGVDDDSPAIQGCFDLAATLLSGDWWTGIKVYAPTGLYRMMSQAVCDIDNRPLAGTPGISLVGDGQQNTYFLADESNQDGLIKLTSNFNTEVWRIYSLGFLSPLEASATVNNGIALEVNSTLGPETQGFGSHRRRSVQIEDVFVGGYGPRVRHIAFGGNFEMGIHIRNKWWPYLTNVHVIGDSPRNVYDNFLPPQPDPSDVPDDSAILKYSPSGRTHAIHFKDCYSPILTEIYVQGHWSHGVFLEGRDEGANPNDYEDFRLADSFLVGQDIGMSVWHADDLEGGVHYDRLHEPGGSISNCHINSNTTGVWLRLHRQVVLDGLYCYVPRGRGRPNFAGLPSSILLDSADEVTIIGCEFLEPGFYFDDDNAACAIRAVGLVTANVVGCTFAAGGVGIHTEGDGTGNIAVSSSQFVGATVDGVWATFVPQVDRAGILAEQYVERIGAGDPGAQHVVRSSAIGTHATVRAVLANARGDYGSVHDAVLGDWRVTGRNTGGTDVPATVIRSRFLDNADGGERSGLEFFVQTGATDPVQVGGFAGTDSDGETNLLLGVTVDGSMSVQRVEVGEADSAGTGFRTLRIAN